MFQVKKQHMLAQEAHCAMIFGQDMAKNVIYELPYLDLST